MTNFPIVLEHNSNFVTSNINPDIEDFDDVGDGNDGSSTGAKTISNPPTNSLWNLLILLLLLH
jgi:hypothetical protein